MSEIRKNGRVSTDAERKAAIETIMRASFRHGYRMALMGFKEPTIAIEWRDGKPRIALSVPRTERLTWMQRLALRLWNKAGRGGTA